MERFISTRADYSWEILQKDLLVPVVDSWGDIKEKIYQYQTGLQLGDITKITNITISTRVVYSWEILQKRLISTSVGCSWEILY